MSRCRVCKKDSKGSLCETCEEGFNRAYEMTKNIKIDLKIGNTYYTTKKSNKDKRQINSIIPVTYLGPTTWFINKWIREGINPYRSGRYDFQYKEIDKKNILYRSFNEIYETRESCYNANKSKFKEDILKSKRDMILDEIRIKLDSELEINPEIIDDPSIINFLINPAVDEITYKEEQYKQIREEIKAEIIKNELDLIRNEIVNNIYEDLKENLKRTKNKFISNELKELSDNYIKSIINAINDYLTKLSPQ